MKTVKKILFAFTLLIGVTINAQTVSRLYSTVNAPTRTPARTDNKIQVYSGNGGVLDAASSIGYKEGNNSPGTKIPSDTSAYFTVYGNLNALGGLAYQYKVDSATKFKMKPFQSYIDFKHTETNDTLWLPPVGAAYAGKVVTVKNSSVNSLVIVGYSKAEYIDTANVYTLTTKKVMSFMITGLSAPTGTVAATNKLNPSYIRLNN